MKYTININWKIILIILTLISIFIVLQIGLEIIPLFDSKMEQNRIEKINNVLLSLSLSYIAGIILYLLINFFPERRKRISNLSMIQKRLDNLLNESFIFIAYLSKKNYASDDILSLKLENFSNIHFLTNNKMNFRYFIEKDSNFTGEFTEITYFKMIKDKSIKTIDDFYRIPSSIYMNNELIELLSELRDCDIFQNIDVSGLLIPIQNFDLQIFNYYNILLNLKNYSNKLEIPKKLEIQM